jgi:hypothetical protein
MSPSHPLVWRCTLRFIALVQTVLGTAFLLAPQATAAQLGLAPAPGWTDWLFGMMAARFLAFGWGMWRAAAAPQANLPWVQAMLGIQAIDWLATLLHLWRGDVTLAQVSTASFLPVVFIALLWWSWPRPAVPAAAAAA